MNNNNTSVLSRILDSFTDVEERVASGKLF